jgi:hypothetical protein
MVSQPDRYPLTPTLSPRGARGKGSRSPCYCEFVFDSISQVDVLRTTHSVSPLSPRGGEGEREPISMLLRICIRLGISGRCTSNNPLGQSPLPQGGEGKGSRSPCYCESVFDSISQVDVLRTTHSVSPLSPRGARGKGADLHAIANLYSTRYLRSMYFEQPTRSVPSPSGRGWLLTQRHHRHGQP